MRLGDELASVDMVRTSRGWVRIGAMPEIAKLLRQARIPPHYVVVLPPNATQVGDAITGEEFICWSSINSAMFAGTYIGSQAALETLRRYLEPSLPYFFDDEHMAIVRRDWLETLYCPQPVDASGVVRFGSVEIAMEAGRVVIRDGRQQLYSGCPTVPPDLPGRIDSFLDRVPRRTPASGLRILVVGSGNGHVGNTSSFIWEFENHRVWVDPAPRPHETLATHGVHWDDVTDLLVTHIHEDHIGGMTACLARARAKGKKLPLWITRTSLEVLQQRLAYLVPDLSNLVEVREILPGEPVCLGEAILISRLNHHILPSGTLGMKLIWKGRSVGFSGDTKYDEAVISRLNRPELTAEWFADCDLVFHEVELVRPPSVHSYYTEVLKLARQLPGRLVVYHTFGNTAPLEMAQEGHWYDL
jgi:ribonuclease BN (tRNA processing enzyme)